MINGISGSQSYQMQYNPYTAVPPVSKTLPIAGTDKQKEISDTSKVNPSECETCKNRTYVDGSNEANVSFKSPGKISPSSSRAVVSAHEQEHVANAKSKGSQEGAQLVSASVRLQTASCPECGTSYIAGGTTTTQIKYTESNPYEQARKTIEGSFFKGQNIDIAA